MTSIITAAKQRQNGPTINVSVSFRTQLDTTQTDLLDATLRDQKEAKSPDKEPKDELHKTRLH